MKKASRTASRWTEKKVYSLILVAVLCLFLLINLFFSLAAERWDLRFDTTDARLYELSGETRAAVEELSAETTVYVLEAEDEYPAVFRELLRRYSRLNPLLQVRYMDPYENPVFVDTYRQQGITLEQADLLVAGQSGAKAIAYSDLLVYSGESFAGIQLEQQVTSAILYVNAGSHASVLFTSGHNERSTQALESVFTGNNYAVSTAVPDREAVGAADLVVIACPTKDFSPEETAVLAEYLSGGGKVLAFFEPGVNDYANLSALLANWGFTLRDDVVFDSQYNVSGSAVNIVPLLTTHAINSYFENNRYPIVMPSSRSLELQTGTTGLSLSPLLMTSASGYAKEGSAFTSGEQSEGDRTGNLVVAAIAERGDGALLVVGSRYLYADDVMETDSYGNRAFITQAADYLAGSGVSVSIPAKRMGSPLLAVTGTQEILAGLILVVLIPLAVLTAGVVVFLKRRKL